MGSMPSVASLSNGQLSSRVPSFQGSDEARAHSIRFALIQEGQVAACNE